MFDREVIKKFLIEMCDSYQNKDSLDYDLIIDAYQVIDGFYVFRVEDNAYFFTDNFCVDSCPGYFLIE